MKDDRNAEQAKDAIDIVDQKLQGLLKFMPTAEELELLQKMKRLDFDRRFEALEEAFRNYEDSTTKREETSQSLGLVTARPDELPADLKQDEPITIQMDEMLQTPAAETPSQHPDDIEEP
jgi:hypothetical protein